MDAGLLVPHTQASQPTPADCQEAWHQNLGSEQETWLEGLACQQEAHQHIPIFTTGLFLSSPQVTS